MKKFAKGYWVISALLVIWAIMDFRNYAAIGKDLVSYYSGQSTVLGWMQNNLFQGIAKGLLAIAIIVFGGICARRKTQLTALTATTWLLIFALFLVWGTGMFCLTSVTAEYAAARYLTGYDDFASIISRRRLEHRIGNSDFSKYKNFDANCLWEAVDDGGQANSFHNDAFVVGEDSAFLNRPNRDRTYSATAVYDAAGNPLACSWWDFFYFAYLTEDQWNTRAERSEDFAQAFFKRELLTPVGQKMVQDSHLTLEAAAMRFTGSFDGIVFSPQKIEYIDWSEYQDVLPANGTDLPWISIYDDPDAASENGKTVTFYSDRFDVCYHQPAPGFAYEGTHYTGVDKLVDRLGPELLTARNIPNVHDGLDLLIPSVNYCFSIGDQIYFSPYYYGEAAYEEGVPELRFYTVSVVYCSPWRTAFDELQIVYLVTLLVSAALVFFLRTIVKRHLIQPVLVVGEALMGDDAKPHLYPDASKAWYESRLIQEGYGKCCDKIQMQKNEITRLNAALEYSKAAEENRRRMTSNITHELKTPLAVIHSYAEGLKEHIAEDKRDQYVGVILGEAERMDGMILEMLDLSRLEAGKVKLSRDVFSLTDLTKAIFDKLQMAVSAKQLQISYTFPEQCTIIADENRIAQVIENFSTNAVKYTPAGGHITVRIQKERNKTTFSIENDSEPLSNEALTKVWDAFYRANESRSGDGTGLGLAIAKNIVALHGGNCSVRNTKSGVEFRFSI